MEATTLFALSAILMPLTLVGTACGHRPADDERSSRSHVIFIDNRDRGWLGVSIDDVTPKLARKKHLNVDEGVFVTDVTEDSPADNAGIREGDVIVEYDGKKIYDSEDLTTEVRKTKPGTDVAVTLFRDGEKKTVKVTIARLRTPRSFSFTFPPLPRIPHAPHATTVRVAVLYGLTLEDLNSQLAEYFGVPDGKGVLVKHVKRNSEADRAGFKAGDVVVKIGKKSIADVDDVNEALDDFNEGDKAEFEILRKGATQKLSLTVTDKERDVSFYRFNGDLLLNLIPPDEDKQFRKEAERLKRELERMKYKLRDDMFELKDRIRSEVERVRLAVTI
jgi:serine protease Do